MICVLTTERRGVDYIGDLTRDVIAQAPAGGHVIVSDGPWSRPVPDGFVVADAPKASHAEAYWRMLRLAADADEPLVALEDDVEICPDALPYMSSFRVADHLALVQFGNMVVAPRAPFALSEWPGGTLLGLWALLIPARTARVLVEMRAPHHDAEAAMALCLEHLRARIGVHCPDLVRHRGAVSCGPRGTRPMPQVNNWIDGLQLPLAGAHAQGRYV